MEEAFGLYTDELKSEDDFFKLYLELRSLLTSYLNQQDNNYKPSYQRKQQFIKDFVNYKYYLGDLDRNKYDQSVHSLIDKSINPYLEFRVMTYNYTQTLEKLLQPVEYVGKYSLDYRAKLEQIIHVHGTLEANDAIIFGVDNETQIKNESLRTSDNVKDFLVKNQSNLSMKYNRSIVCEEFIEKANIIILYGVSIGETDSRWWNLIGEQFNKRNDLIIIHFIYKTDDLGNPSKLITGRVEREQKDKLMKKMGFINKEEWPENTNERLFFVVNSNAFKER